MNFDRMKPLVLTGWTFWGDSNYKDVVTDNLKERIAYFDSIKFPSYVEFKNMSPDEAKTLMEETNLKREKINALYLKECADSLALEEKIREVVIQEVKKCNYHFSGDYHQHGDYGTPIINDTYIYCVSCREWGHIIAEAYPDEDYLDLKEETRYLKWAWSSSSLDGLNIYPN